MRSMFGVSVAHHSARVALMLAGRCHRPRGRGCWAAQPPRRRTPQLERRRWRATRKRWPGRRQRGEDDSWIGSGLKRSDAPGRVAASYGGRSRDRRGRARGRTWDAQSLVDTTPDDPRSTSLKRLRRHGTPPSTRSDTPRPHRIALMNLEPVPRRASLSEVVETPWGRGEPPLLAARHLPCSWPVGTLPAPGRSAPSPLLAARPAPLVSRALLALTRSLQPRSLIRRWACRCRSILALQ